MQALTKARFLRVIGLAGITFSLLLLLKVTTAYALPEGTTWYVDGSVVRSLDGVTPERALKTIAEATQRVAVGDTIIVAAGIYTGRVDLPSGITLQGTGYQSTTLYGAGDDVVVLMEQSSTIRGFTITGSGNDFWDAGVWMVGGDITISHNRITANGKGIVADDCGSSENCGAASLAAFNIIDNNRTQGIYAGEQNTITIRNNTVVSNTNFGIVVSTAGSIIENNIISLHDKASIEAPPTALARNNSVYNFGRPYPAPAYRVAPFQVDPLFQNLVNSDYRLSAGSPLRGEALPPAVDLGALPFVPKGPIPTALAILSTTESYAWKVTWAITEGYQTRLYLRNPLDNSVRRIDTGNAEFFILHNLPGAIRYALSASSYVTTGSESELSEKLELTVPALEEGVYQENSAALAFAGQWQTRPHTQTMGNAESVSEQPSDQFEFAFVGESVVITRSLHNNGGRMQIFIDDKLYDAIEFYFPKERFQVPAVIDQLGPGTHRLKLIVSNERFTKSGGKRVTIDAIQIPSPYIPNEQQSLALTRTNYYRQIAKLPPVKMVAALNLSAQAHANYILRHGITDGAHEQESLAGFTGEFPSNRAAYFGYSYFVGEDLHEIGDPLQAIDSFMGTVYQRKLLLNYYVQDMGYAVVVDGETLLDVLDMGSRQGPTQTLQNRLIYTYPADQQTDVPTAWDGLESPDPLPNVPRPVGYPISFYIIQPENIRSATTRMGQKPTEEKKWKLSKATLTNATGQEQEVYILDAESDPKNTDTDQVNLLAKTPLLPGNTYTARFIGTDSRGVDFDHTLTFTTRSQPISHTVFLPAVLAE